MITLTLWVIGWGITAGIVEEDCKRQGVKYNSVMEFTLFFFWPVQLGTWIARAVLY